MPPWKPATGRRLDARGRPGKIAVVPTKPLTNQRDLALAYSPGVAEPCLEIQRNPECAYKYTAKGNLVAVVSNGTREQMEHDVSRCHAKGLWATLQQD